MTKKEFIEKFNLLEKPSKIPEGFINGEGYIQQDLHLIEELKSNICELYNNKYNFSLLGRLLNDNESELYHYWIRLMCIDSYGREWGQPYFTRNSDLFGKDDCINPKAGKKFMRRAKIKKINKTDE